MTDTSPEPESTTSARRDVVVPDKAVLEGLEARWSERWKNDETYKFDRTAVLAERLTTAHPDVLRELLAPPDIQCSH